MALSAAEIAALVFRRAQGTGETQFTMTTQMIDILAAMDGQRNLGELVQQTGVDIGTVKSVAAQLLNAKLVELVKSEPPAVDNEFTAFLLREMSLAIGPLAEVVIEDAMHDLGCPEGPLPQGRAAELVDLLSKEISRPEKRSQFQTNMVGKLKEKGYFA